MLSRIISKDLIVACSPRLSDIQIRQVEQFVKLYSPSNGRHRRRIL